LTQLGYVSGLLFITPLGDILERRQLIIFLLIFSGISLFAAANSPNFFLFTLASFFVGLSAVLTQVIIPFVAWLSAPAERGKNLGMLLSGALTGILLSRALSGLIGAHWGWRMMFEIASGIMFALALTLYRTLPRHESTSQNEITYPQLLHSIWTLFRDIPQLRSIALSGAFVYASLSGFWATLAFYLSSDAYQLGPDVAGIFGLIGAAGALSVAIVGRQVEKIGPRKIVQICIGMMITSFCIFAFLGSHLPFLILGVVLLDMGAQATTVSNQTQLYQLHRDAQSRLNTIYKIFYFCGGAIGSASAAIAWQNLGWLGVCIAGMIYLSTAWIIEKMSRYHHCIFLKHGPAATCAVGTPNTQRL
jgi:predicted MFS family arabinose efflux permease